MLDTPGREESRCLHSVGAACALFARLAAAPVEFAGIAYVSRDRRILGLRLVRGGIDCVEVETRTLAIDALAFGAHGIVMAHNHPSGDPTPSAHDLAHVRRATLALAGIEVRMIDHLIVASGGVVSLRALGIV